MLAAHIRDVSHDPAHPPFELKIDGFPRRHFRVHSFTGKEAIYASWSFDVVVTAEHGGDLVEQKALAVRATLLFHTAVRVGDMDPVDEPTEIRKRLEHLGCYDANPGDDVDATNARAMANYQRARAARARSAGDRKARPRAQGCAPQGAWLVKLVETAVLAALAGVALAGCDERSGAPHRQVPAPTTPTVSTRPQAAASMPTSGSCAVLRARLALDPASDGKCDRAACAAAGGECGWAGFSCEIACVRRSRDAGAACSDVSECEGTCVAPASAGLGDVVKGSCYHLALDKACLNRVRQGKAEGKVCVD